MSDFAIEHVAGLTASKPPPELPIDPWDQWWAYFVEFVMTVAESAGVLGFNIGSATSPADWIMPVTFQLALLAGGALLRVKFAIKTMTAPTIGQRAFALVGLAAGTCITATALYQAGITAYAPRDELLRDTRAALVEATQADDAFQVKYRLAQDAVKAAQDQVKADAPRTGKAATSYERKDRSEVAAAKKALKSLDPIPTAKRKREAQAASLKAERSNLYNRMGADWFGEGAGDTGATIMRRLAMALPCLFAPLGASLFVIVSAKGRRKPEPKPKPEKTITLPDETVPHILKIRQDAIDELTRLNAPAPAAPPLAEAPAALPVATRNDVRSDARFMVVSGAN